MKMTELEHTVRSFIGTICGVEAAVIRSDARLAEYGFDSIRAMDLLVSLEEIFGIVIPDEIAGRVRTFNDVVSYLEQRLAPASTLRGARA
jgi:acyl carrier protein